MTMIRIATAATALAIAATGALPAAAKTCKEPVSARSTSRIAGDDAARKERAKANAIKRWSKDVQAKYGITFKFWLTAADKSSECGHTAKSAHCTVTATPCRPF